ncbi:MAG: hypothetical protein A2161_19780, partial [Candidatus Schekmanbacteria bacterium RBG_13_48_7]
MRIGINCYVLSDQIGGIKQYFFTLISYLSEHSDHKLIFFGFKHNVKLIEDSGIVCKEHSLILLNSQEDILDNLNTIDLYFCPFNSYWPRPVPVPSVFTLHDIQEKYYPEYFTVEDRFNREFHYPASLKNADHIITVSNFSKESIVKHYHVSPRKIAVVHNAIDPIYFGKIKAIKPQNISLPANYIFYPANTWLHKNHDTLLKALKHLKESYSRQIHCVFSGANPPNNYPLAEKVIEYQLQDHVTCL